MIVLLVAAGVLTALGWPIARRMAGPRAMALPLSPAIAALMMTVAAIASLVTRTPLLPWVATVAVAAFLAARRMPTAEPPGVSWLEMAAIAALPSFLLLTFRQPPMAWDARSIWWFHAEWFLAGGARAATAIGNSLNTFSHSDYPPLGSATTAGLWAITGDDHARLAQAGTTVLTWCGLLLLASLVYLLMPHRGTFEVALCGGLVIAVAVLFPGHATNGYVDVLWSAWLAAAAAVLLLHRVDTTLAPVGVVALAVAALTKNEALPACLALVLLYAIRARGQWRRALVPAAVVLPALGWVALVRSLGAQPDLATGAQISGLLAFDAAFLDGFRQAWEGVVPYMLGPSAWWAAVVLLSIPHLVRRRRSDTVGSGAWLPVLSACIVASTIAAYMLSPHDLAWHIANSVPRVTIVGRVLLLVEIVLWVAWAAQEIAHRRRTAASVSRPAMGTAR